jgi:hypothetical protein
MARIRNLKPEFWTDGNIVQLSFAARLFYQGTWNFALCDRGHLPDDPMELKLKILPADDVDPAELVEELVKFGRIVREETRDGRKFLRVVRLPDHNKVDPRWSPRCPYCIAEHAEPPGSSEEPRGASPKLPDTPGSHTGPPRNSAPEGKGREGKGEEGKETSAKPPTDDAPPRVDVERLCNHLADRVAANGSKRPKVTKAWRDAARLLLDRDGRTAEQVHAAIDWCQDSDFWHRNILSMPKLREKYEQLQLAAKPSRSNGRPTNQHVESSAGDALAEVFG